MSSSNNLCRRSSYLSSRMTWSNWPIYKAILGATFFLLIFFLILPQAFSKDLTPKSSSTKIDLSVPIVTALTPGWESGTGSVTFSNLALPGQQNDVISRGWTLSTNWINGYEVRVRSASSPALRGANAIDGDGAAGSFSDFTTSGCPCDWNVSSATKGVFGYTINVKTLSGFPAKNHARWGSGTQEKWRGFTQVAHPAYSTPGGEGRYEMSIKMRSEIPEKAVQPSGSYRANVIVSAHPLM